MVFSSNFIGPLLGYPNTSILGPLFYGIHVGLTGYAILKYQLFDIEFVIKKGVQYLITTGLFYSCCLVTIRQFSSFLRGGENSALLEVLLSTTVLIFLFPYLKLAVDVATEKLFFRLKQDFNLSLKKIADKDISSLTAETFLAFVGNELISNLKLTHLSIVCFPKKAYYNEPLMYSNSPRDLSAFSMVGEALFSKIDHPVWVTEDIIKSIEAVDASTLEILTTKEISLIFPVINSPTACIGMFIGKKRSDQSFMIQDLDYLNGLSFQLSNRLESLIGLKDIESKSNQLKEINTVSLFLNTLTKEEPILIELNRRLQRFFKIKPLVSYRVINDEFDLLMSNEALINKQKALSITDKISGVIQQILEGTKRRSSDNHAQLLSSVLLMSVQEDFSLKDGRVSLLYFPIKDDAWFCSLIWTESITEEQDTLKVLLTQTHMALSNCYSHSEINHQHQFHEQLLDNMISGAIIFDAFLNIDIMNQIALSYFNGQDDVTESISLFSIIEYFPELKIIETALIEKREESVTFEKKTSEGVRYFSATARYFEWNSQKGVLLILSDYTALKTIESKGYQLNRLGSLAAMAKGVANKISPPLKELISLARDVEIEWADAKFRKRYDALAITHIDSINGLCKTLVEMSKPQVQAIEKIHAGSFLDHLKEILEYDGGKVTVDTNDSLWFWADKGQLLHVLVNVGANAIQASDSERSEVAISLKKEDSDTINIHVRDQGIGVTAPNQSYVFDPFYSTKPKHLGLGLTVAERIVKSFDGSIKLESSSDGTTVSIVFPETKRVL